MKIVYIIPVYNDEESLLKLIDEINTKYKNYENYFLVINDRSTNQLNKIKEINNLTLLNLNKNLGSQNAIFVGLKYLKDNITNFDYTIIMDSDGEDDPSGIKNLIEKTIENENNSIIFASRGQRNENIFYKILYFFYKLLFKNLTGKIIDFGNFSCVPKKIVFRLTEIETISHHYSASVIKSKVNYYTIKLNRGKRFFGESKMNFNSFLLHGIKSLSIFYEDILVRLIVFSLIGIMFSLISILFLILTKIFYTNVLLGWTSEMIMGSSIILVAFLLMIFSCILVLLNKKNYTQEISSLTSYKNQIESINKN
tara:strand:- start:912 stop:1844 length:933 start_codon:yes stop_codon:yes gene_type:complete